MQITFSTEAAAEAAVEIWERHGFTAARSGTTILTDCPSLWAVTIIDRAIGLHQVERLDLHARPDGVAGAPQRGSAVLELRDWNDSAANRRCDA